MDKIFKSRKEIINYLESYSKERKSELDQKFLKKELVKSYLIETFSDQEKQKSIQDLFKISTWNIEKIDEDMYQVFDTIKGTTVGFLEQLFRRYYVLYTLLKIDEIERNIMKIIKDSVFLDNMWFSGNFFLQLLRVIFDTVNIERYIRLKFEHESFFEEPETFEKSEKPESEEAEEDVEYRKIDEEELIIERKTSSFAFTDRIEETSNILPELQKLVPTFYALSLLRYPSLVGRGGHEFYHFGKVTNRSDSFKDHRNQILFTTRLYGLITEYIEAKAWFCSEKILIGSAGSRLVLKGTPINISFSKELDRRIYENFIVKTFERGQGPFRLWGNPIRVSDKTVHVYGLDLHLWQQIFIELTPRRITLILPKGTCGNTIHRLITNIQRFLDPNISVTIGDERYGDIMKNLLQEVVKHGE